MNRLRKKTLLKSLFMMFVSVLCFCGVLFIVNLVFIFHMFNGSTEADRPVTPVFSSRAFGNLDTPQELYLDLLKVVLTRYGLEDHFEPLMDTESRIGKIIAPLFGRSSFFRRVPFNPSLREHGRDWPRNAETMIGLRRLDNLQYCVTDVLHRNVPGDLIECGAWRGGSCIFMRAVLKAYGDLNRKVWVADSFEGLPKPDADKQPEDAELWRGGEMAVSLEQVKKNFARYGLLDNQVYFLKGFFIDTLPNSPIGQLAILRVDCDLYESVTQSLEYLYDRVSVGGYVIIDDYGALNSAKRAVEDYRRAHGITEEIKRIDWTGVYWQKQR